MIVIKSRSWTVTAQVLQISRRKCPDCGATYVELGNTVLMETVNGVPVLSFLSDFGAKERLWANLRSRVEALGPLRSKHRRCPVCRRGEPIPVTRTSSTGEKVVGGLIAGGFMGGIAGWLVGEVANAPVMLLIGVVVGGILLAIVNASPSHPEDPTNPWPPEKGTIPGAMTEADFGAWSTGHPSYQSAAKAWAIESQIMPPSFETKPGQVVFVLPPYDAVDDRVKLPRAPAEGAATDGPAATHPVSAEHPADAAVADAHLARLDELRAAGILSDEEHAAAKGRLGT